MQRAKAAKHTMLPSGISPVLRAHITRFRAAAFAFLARRTNVKAGRSGFAPSSFQSPVSIAARTRNWRPGLSAAGTARE